MPNLASAFKRLALPAMLAASGMAYAQGGAELVTDPWYSGQSRGFWGLSDSVGVRSVLPGTFNPPGSNAESLNAIRQYGGYRLSDAFAIEGSQTRFGPSDSGCNGYAGDTAYGAACNGSSAWSLSGVATLPFESGLSLYGRLGLQHWQGAGLEDPGTHHNYDDPGNIGKVYGIGLSYGLTKSITFHAESERYSELMNNNPTGPSANFGLDSSVHSIGLSIKF
jgi:hypothetical protein